MQLANQEAQRFSHEYIGTEHVLLGLVAEGSGVAANVLRNLDIDLRKIRAEIEKNVQDGLGELAGRLPHNPHAKRVFQFATEEAKYLNHQYVGTEHLLLGLLREGEGIAAEVLRNCGLSLEDVREEVLNLLGHNMPTAADATDTPNLTAAQLQLVHDRIRQVYEQREVFVAALDFALAARCREEAVVLTALLAWYEASQAG